MPMLLELQRAVYRGLVAEGDADCSAHVINDGITAAARLGVYRNTFIGSLTAALSLVYPAVHRLVGAPFFESVAHLFVEATPPQSAWLDEYGADFPEFLAGFAPAAALPDLPGVARLEQAVNRALHAADAPPLDLSRLAGLPEADLERIAFVPHPALGLVTADRPVDAIWHAVLARDEAAMAAIDLAAGPVWFLVERGADGVAVRRLGEPEWRLLSELCAARPLFEAVAAAPEIDAATLLTRHLAAGRFIEFALESRFAAHARNLQFDD